MVRIKSLILATCLLSSASAGIAAGANHSGVSTSLVLNKARFLSTEKATATLTIANQTSQAILFPWYSIVFLVRSGSRWEEQSILKVISRMPTPMRVAPYSTFTMSVNLPTCTVYSDSCTEDLIVKYPIPVGGETRWFQTALPRYEFVPDPTATYDVPALSGNRPVFIVTGLARDTVFPDTIRIEFTASPTAVQPPFSATPALVGELVQALNKEGVATGEVGFDTDGSTWKAQVYVGNASSQRENIARALMQVRQSFRSQISAIDQQLVFEPFPGADRVSDQAHATARLLARELAESTGSGDIAPAFFAQPLVYLGDQGSDAGIPALTHASPYDRAVVLQQTNLNPTPIAVVVNDLFTGAQTPELSENSTAATSAASAFRQPDSWSEPPVHQQPVIAADRPEIYVTGTASVSAALNRGLAPYFVATLAAHSETAFLAQILGVKLGHESLFAAYRLDNQDSDLRTLGVATTFSGGDSGRWQRIKPDPAIRVNHRIEDPRQKAMLPIAVPDEGTTISEWAGAQITVTPVDRAAQFRGTPRASNCSNLEERLLKATIRQNWIRPAGFLPQGIHDTAPTRRGPAPAGPRNRRIGEPHVVAGLTAAAHGLSRDFVMNFMGLPPAGNSRNSTRPSGYLAVLSTGATTVPPKIQNWLVP